MEPKAPRTRTQKLVRWGVIIALVIVGLYIVQTVISHHNNAKLGNNVQTTTTAPAQLPPSNVPVSGIDTSQPAAPIPTNVGSTVPSAVLPAPTSAEKAAVNFAATALSTLSVAKLLDASSLNQVIDTYVAPAQQAQMKVDYPRLGQFFASELGYSTTAQALASAAYQVNAQEYRIVQLTATKAVIDLYVISQVTTADQSQFIVPGITVITLQADTQGWLYVQSADPPVDEVPTPETGLTSDETKARFGPYLKGYSNVQTVQ